MRCVNCNIDLGESYKRCPLCGENAKELEPLIKNQTTAEYPVIKRKKAMPAAFDMFLTIWALSLLSVLCFCLIFKTGLSYFYISAFIVPCIWTVLLRPIFVRQLYCANYAVTAVLPVTALFLCCEAVSDKSVVFSLTVIMPVMIIISYVVMLISAFIKPSSGKRAAPYCVLFLFAGAVGFAVSSVIIRSVAVMWLAVFVVSLAALAVTLLVYKQQAKEEIKAKFSIQ